MVQLVIITGTLALNKDAIYQCNYILKDAEVHKPE
jgi:hypothetical protein